jgi:hypothetical protein
VADNFPRIAMPERKAMVEAAESASLSRLRRAYYREQAMEDLPRQKLRDLMASKGRSLCDELYGFDE